MINEVRGPAKAVMGVEDPVSIRIDGVNHFQLRPGLGFGYPEAIRSALSQACDLLFISDLPDLESAEAACHAASSGCLVLCSLAADSAPAAITRLLHMGCRPHLLASALTGVTNQRLVRRVCGKCGEEASTDDLSPSERKFLGDFQIQHFRRGAGCDNCGNTGYRHRGGLYEMFDVTEAVAEVVLRQGNTDEVRQAAIAAGMKAIRENGLEKVAEGVTTPAELIRALA